MNLRKWWGMRRAKKHFAYIRTLWIEQLRVDIQPYGIGITGNLKVYCGFCHCTECRCGDYRNDKLAKVRAELRRIHELHHNDVKNTLDVIEKLERDCDERVS
jgi:hypothetical protein